MFQRQVLAQQVVDVVDKGHKLFEKPVNGITFLIHCKYSLFFIDVKLKKKKSLGNPAIV